jgi:hypothetical protein
MMNTAFSLQRTLLNTSAMSASPLVSRAIVATGVSTQPGSSGVASAEELDCDGGISAEELDSPF